MSVWWPGEWDRFITKIEDWVLKKNGYTKLQTQRISKGCQSLITKPRNDLVCTTFRFSPVDSCRRNSNDDIRFEITKQSESIQLERRLNSLDKMDRILKQYEQAFAKLPKRGPKYPNQIQNQNLDILNEDVIQNMFRKCYTKRIEYEIPTSRV